MESVKTVDATDLGRRIAQLLRVRPHATIEIQLLKDGSVRILRLQEEAGDEPRS